ncbi:hypothetical protein BDV38DRAFT_280575 [Aspergillus pseudotamarii]|uniref:Uncharacterized protein n=1 Tax=Aspergillus pseudotamarii TaxID=132259 RepID=A0A5N6T186_ASPPS|nr:uncharacterized protein BDV38DRAFT_280575 [Aspergillus pseudotamarii]KAE8140110.1 hypothetical protein BDV38DRAFT_280575 [Aspergillus pseudotamarii]
MKHFEAWYPQLGSRLNAIMLRNCGEQLEYYRNDSTTYNSCVSCQAETVEACLENAPEWMKASMSVGVGCRTEAVETCILENAPEWIKSNMAAAGVLLGLLPTILSLAGSSTVETGLLAQRRPFLALLLAAGAPAVSPIRTFEYRDPLQLLCGSSNSIQLLPALQNWGIWRFAIIPIQYLLAMGAVANVAHTSWQLGIQTLCSFSTETTFHPLLWTFSALILDILGTIGVKLRIRFDEPSDDPPITRLGKSRRIVGQEFRLSADQGKASVTFKRQSYAFTCTSWCTSTGTILHLIYGTLTFSSIVFISTQDALGVVARYLASTIICRIILMFEIHGMRTAMQGEAGGVKS